MAENFNHQHQNVRVENGVEYGDLIKFDDFEYMARVGRLNAATLATLGSSPGMPQAVTVVTRNLDNNTTLHWQAPLSAGADVHYQIVWRETAMPDWQYFVDAKKYQDAGADGKGLSATLPVSKDNVFFGVRACDAKEHCSQAVRAYARALSSEIQGRRFFVAAEAQPRAEVEADLTREAVAKFWEELLRRFILRVGVDAKNVDAAIFCHCLRLQHQRSRDALPAERWIHGEAVNDDCWFCEVPADLCVLRLLVGGDGCNTAQGSVDLRQPELRGLYVPLEHFRVRVVIVPLQIPAVAHERNDATHELHDSRNIPRRRQTHTHTTPCKAYADGLSNRKGPFRPSILQCCQRRNQKSEMDGKIG